MTCANCGGAIPSWAIFDHKFYEGVGPASLPPGESPERTWTITAPLYFKANQDNTAMVEGYCGPQCAAARLA
jgi:hypothetical protein